MLILFIIIIYIFILLFDIVLKNYSLYQGYGPMAESDQMIKFGLKCYNFNRGGYRFIILKKSNLKFHISFIVVLKKQFSIKNK